MSCAAEVRAYVERHLEEVLEDLAELVRRESPSTDRELLDAFLDHAEAYARTRLGEPRLRRRHAGGRCGDILELEWAGTAPGTVLSLCHYDTVWPRGTLAGWPVRRDGDVLTGPGVLDMKVGIVQTVWMLRALRELGAAHPGVRLMLTGDEELGSPVSRPLLEAAAGECTATLISEPSADGDVKVQRKGVVLVDVAVTGVEAHAGLEPHKGASAVHELARLIGQMTAVARPELGTTVNVGNVHGGTGRNVVAGQARCEVDVRIQLPEEEERVVQAFEALRTADERCALEVRIERNRPPMNPSAAACELLEAARRIGRELGTEVGHQPVGGASDGNFIAALGLPVIDGLGGIGAGPHARHEHIRISGLPRQTALMAGLVEHLAQA